MVSQRQNSSGGGPSRFAVERSALLVVDVQDKLLPHIHQAKRLLGQLERLVQGAAVLGVTTLVTEQYPKGLGATDNRLMGKLTHALCNVQKLRFSAWDQRIAGHLKQSQASHVVVCGIESHVCVLQTCLDLKAQGFCVAVVVDAVGSRRDTDKQIAMSRLLQAGVVPTSVESILLEWVGEAGTPQFKAILPLIRDN